MASHTSINIDPRLDELHNWLTDRSSMIEDLYPQEQQRAHDLVDALLVDGVDVDDPTAYRKTLLASASGAGCLAAMQLLIDHGSRLDPPAVVERNPNLSYRHTPLMLASSYNKVEACRLLVKAGADLETVDEEGESALFWAAKHSAADATECLIKLGADPRRVNNENHSVLTQWLAFDSQVGDEGWADCGRLLVQAAAAQGHSLVRPEILADLDEAGANELGQELLALQEDALLEQTTAAVKTNKSAPRL